MTVISLDAVHDVRARIARAHERAAEEFRQVFVLGVTPPTRHLEIVARTLIEEARSVRVTGDPYRLENGLIVPLYENFEFDDVFEYWMLASEIAGSAAWRMTRVIAAADEYDEALRRMQSPQIVRALVASFLPSWERDSLEVTVYTRADEERIERRMLTIDAGNEFHFHSRELIAEGRGGVTI